MYTSCLAKFVDVYWAQYIVFTKQKTCHAIRITSPPPFIKFGRLNRNRVTESVNSYICGSYLFPTSGVRCNFSNPICQKVHSSLIYHIERNV